VDMGYRGGRVLEIGFYRSSPIASGVVIQFTMGTTLGVVSGSRQRRRCRQHRNGVNVSAYQVNRDTIDLMVSVLIEWGGPGGRSPYIYTFGALPTDDELLEETEGRGGHHVTRATHSTADALGRELIDANVKSLTARYSDGVEMCGYYSEGYTWRRVTSDEASIARAMGAVKCYQYQACEYDEWRTSFAHELSARVMDKLVDMISEGWDYERPANAPRVISLMDIVRENKGGK
jgi:hypothetical protein